MSLSQLDQPWKYVPRPSLASLKPTVPRVAYILWSKECGQEHCEPHPLLSAIRIYEGVAHHKAAPTEQTIQALSAQRTLRVLSLRACVNISDDSIEELTVACPGLSTLDLAHLPGITVRV